CVQGISEDVGLSLAEVQTFEFPGQLRQLPQSLVHRVRVRFGQSIEQRVTAIERLGKPILRQSKVEGHEAFYQDAGKEGPLKGERSGQVGWYSTGQGSSRKGV